VQIGLLPVTLYAIVVAVEVHSLAAIMIGLSVLALAAVPLGLSPIQAAFRVGAALVGVLVGVFAFVTTLAGGWLILPTSVLLLVAAVLPRD
jgi:hypothetical protein